MDGPCMGYNIIDLSTKEALPYKMVAQLVTGKFPSCHYVIHDVTCKTSSL